MLQSRSYLYAGAPTPVSVIFLVDTNFNTTDNKDMEDLMEVKNLNTDKRFNNIVAYEFAVRNGNTVGNARKLLENYDLIIKPYLKEVSETQDIHDVTVNPLDSLQQLVRSYPPEEFDEDPEENDHEVYIDNEELTFRLSTTEFEYDDSEQVSIYKKQFREVSKESLVDDPRALLKYTKENHHWNSLEFSRNKKPSEVKKYFHEVPIAPSFNEQNIEKKNKAGGHYDWRFFSGIIEDEEETRRTLHHMLRSFLKFTFAKNIPTWVAHGSLLSWYWNSLNFPWDNDIDVQMPIKDLQRFCKLYNNTLIVENLNDGMGKYYVDCGSYLTHRTKGFGRNNIDARFIDIDKGIYIDITGLALTDAQ